MSHNDLIIIIRIIIFFWQMIQFLSSLLYFIFNSHEYVDS